RRWRRRRGRWGWCRADDPGAEGRHRRRVRRAAQAVTSSDENRGRPAAARVAGGFFCSKSDRGGPFTRRAQLRRIRRCDEWYGRCDGGPAMAKITLLAAFLLCGCFAHIPMHTTEHMNVRWRASYQEAQEEALRTGKPIVVVMTAGEKNGDM